MSDRGDSYGGFAGHYDLHGWDWYASVHGPRLFRLLDDRGVTPGRALDAGCGTGTLALALAGRGWAVTGLDLSQPMLDVARRKDVEGRVTWRQGDITAFDATAPDAGASAFDLITCVADTLNHLETLDEWEAAFRRFASHLRTGGLLFLDAMTSRGLERLDKYTVVDVEDRTLILGIIWEPASRRSTVKVASFVPAAPCVANASTSGGPTLYEKAVETVAEWGQPVEGILERLEKAGFARTERLWPTRPDPEQEDRLAILARRR